MLIPAYKSDDRIYRRVTCWVTSALRVSLVRNVFLPNHFPDQLFSCETASLIKMVLFFCVRVVELKVRLMVFPPPTLSAGFIFTCGFSVWWFWTHEC